MSYQIIRFRRRNS